MRYVTDQQVEGFQSLADAEDKRAVIALAERVYNYINANPWITDTRLTTYAENNGIDLDQMRQAIALLVETDRLVEFDVTQADIDNLTESVTVPTASPPAGE